MEMSAKKRIIFLILNINFFFSIALTIFRAKGIDIGRKKMCFKVQDEIYILYCIYFYPFSIF